MSSSPFHEIQWTEQEKSDLERRIRGLRDDQLGALIEIAGLGFRKQDLEDVVHDIKTDGLQSGHLEIVLAEADSRDDLLWWLEYFERYREWPRT